MGGRIDPRSKPAKVSEQAVIRTGGKQYRVEVGTKVKVEQYDPRPDSDAEEWAQKYGIQGQQLGLMGPVIYFGLVVVAGDTEQLVPALDPRTQQMLEYNLTRTIYRVTHPEKPVIGVMSSLPVLGQQQPMMMPGQPPPPQSSCAMTGLRQEEAPSWSHPSSARFSSRSSLPCRGCSPVRPRKRGPKRLLPL